MSDEVNDAEAEDQDTAAAAENTLICLVTNNAVKATEKERTLQAIIRSLSMEYGFNTTDMARDFRLAGEDPDTGKRRGISASLVIFGEGEPHEQENVIRICIVQDAKLKATDAKKGLANLESCMGFVLGEQTAKEPGCEFGMWTNGSELYFLQKIWDKHEPEPRYEELADFPGKGENLDDLDRPDRQMLRVAAGESLLNAFKRCHDYIYGNQGKIKTAFWELLNVIFCKIYDERLRDICAEERKTYRRRFWVGVKERNTEGGRAAIAKRITEIFEEVKKSAEFKDVFDGNERIALNDKVLSYIAAELSRYSFLDASIDTKGLAYESIVSNTLKKEQGQFFTPRNVIRLMVQMLDPTEDQMVCDPACGSAGFLVMVLDHIRLKIAKELYPDEDGALLRDRANNDRRVVGKALKYAQKKLYGIDFDPDLRKAARMNMVMAGDGHGNIFSFNSLEFPRGANDDIHAAVKKGIMFAPDGGCFDLVFTNPPFGAKIPVDDPESLKSFDLGHRWNKNGEVWVKGKLHKSQPPEILFIERCYQLLKPGGRMAIVLPDGILGNPDLAYVRAWILRHCKVLASVDLPVETFLPQVGVQSSLLFLQRKTREEQLLGKDQDYDVFMAIAEKIGKDRRGNPIYVRDEDGADLTFAKTLEEIRRLPNGKRELRRQELQEKEVDDDLPRIKGKWDAFVKGEKL